jgi:diguanylate cyclase (GGDEF)-like protein
MSPDTVPIREEKVRANGRRVAQLRTQREWSREELGEKAGYSKRTIDTIETGGDVKRSTLVSVAKALDVAVEKLLAPAGPEAPAGTVVVELTLDQPFDSLPGPQQEQFFEAVKKQLSLAGNVRALGRPERSVEVVLGLAAADADLLVQGVLEGRLNNLGVEGAWLFVAPELRRADPPHPVAAPHRARPSRTKCSVLVVDDESYVRGVLRRLLQDDFEVLEAASAEAAQAALEQAAQEGGSIDLLLTDQEMPGRKGVQLLEWVKEKHPNTIRLLMTGYEEFKDVIAAINRGQVSYCFTKPFRDDVLRVLLLAAEKVALKRKRDRRLEKLRASNRKLKRQLEKANNRVREQLERKAVTDPLTDLPNRVGIEAQARGELESPARGRPLSVGLIEVDQFGPTAGETLRGDSDEAVRRVARVLAGVLRASDSVGRLDGARFLVLARETGEHGAARLGERLRTTVAARLGEQYTLSIGFAVADADVHEGLDELLALATAALEQARSSGRDCCQVRKLPKKPAPPRRSFPPTE